MNIHNKYGFVSGGYLFDKMDRIAQDYIESRYPELKYWVTKEAFIKYMKQVCSVRDIGFKLRIRTKIGNSVYVTVCVYESGKPMKCLCEAAFVFVGKNKLYCKETRDGK